MIRDRTQIPTATYRLQFNKFFTFAQARALVPYLAELGISHVYSSPFFNAGPDSLHGYDICNHNELNPVIGTREEFDAFVEELHAHGMGHIVDFVPNHMGITSQLNTWWLDVLENGPSSRFAPYFDIDWQPVKSDLENRVLLPVLGDQYGRVLERGELKLHFENGAFFVRYFDKQLPVAPRTYAIILEPVLAKLEQLDVSDEFKAEFQSVLTALSHLPARTETTPEKVEERGREKEVIKRRLQRRCEECPDLVGAIQEAMREIEGTAGDARSFDRLDQLLSEQCFRLSFWRVAAEEINYRRFFDINDLAAIRVELPEVFESTHAFVFHLVESGHIDGLRIDHVDGLWNPREYLTQLQTRCAPAFDKPAGELPLYLLVEKILIGNERLRRDWPVHGTTGYEFANDVIRLLVDPAAETSITETYDRFIGGSPRFADIAYQRKQLVMRLALASEVNVLAFMLDRLSERNRWFRDFTLNALTTAVREVIACFPVYRTYVTAEESPTAEDGEAVRRAVTQAQRRNPGIEKSVFDFLGGILLRQFPENIDEAARAEHLRFVLKFQQCTGPIMAKGVEDTSFYIYLRLAALNEVGGEPNHFAYLPETFFQRCSARAQEHPHSMLATSTHDTKRSEDVRARMAAISEMPAAWRRLLRQWRTLNQQFRTEVGGEFAPDANEEYLIYQTLLGSWPLAPQGLQEQEEYVARIQAYMIKAIKEAKINSSWIQPNEAWENAVKHFIERVLQPRKNRFLKSFEPVALEIAQLGAVNALSQLVLKATAPGMPDFYQGCDLWDFSLVDPDNRRPVDYELRKRLLQEVASASPAELSRSWTDGRIKLFITHRLLTFRRAHAALFRTPEFVPVAASGAFAEQCVAFLRRSEGSALLVIVPRLTRRVGFPPIGAAWRDTAIELPRDLVGKPLRELFTGRELTFQDGAMQVSTALAELPVAVFALV